MDIKLFFSWQSDTDSKKLQHTKFIKKCIQSAIAKVNKELKHVNIEYQEGIKGISGAPDIVTEIEERISKCHIFIGDLTFINQEPMIIRWLKKIFGIKHKTTSNPNVIRESSLFMARPFMKYQGFYVLNSVFGNPVEDESQMFFDQRGKRFPLSFALKQYNDNVAEVYEKEQKEFISALTGAIKECAEQAIFHLDEDIKPFLSWNGHYEISGFDDGYIVNGLEQYLQQIKENKENLRICGLSGLGKTRMVYEAFKDDSIRYLYCYIDCQEHKEEEIIEKTTFMFKHYKEMVLVFDNCDMELHNKIVRVKRSKHATNPIITIHNDPDENSTYHSTPLKLQKNFNDVVERILERFKSFYKPEDKEKLLTFAGGIPMMAQLLVEGLRNGDPIGVVSDAALMNKILDANENSDDRKIMRTLSLFNFIGFEGDLHKELEFVATTKCITSIDKDSRVLVQDFDRVILKYLKRKIVERKGRLIGIRPIPIALYLISEWIEQCSDARLLAVIKAIQESEIAKPLTDSFADQFRYMGHNAKACNMLNQLLGAKSPFGTAEVLNTDLGSRLFRSFVEVNPEAVADCLWSVIGSISIDGLRLIDKGRRNLVWTIEKLCFEPRTFDKGAEMMMLLAMAENEHIGNNATGQFIALFPLYLPATAATLEQRLLFLQRQVQYMERQLIVLSALGRALRTRDFFFFGGAEQRGTEKLSNYQPKTNKEISEYIHGCLDVLMGLVEANPALLDRCSEILESNLGCLCEAGYGNSTMNCIHKIAELRKYSWDKMLDAIRFVLHHKAIRLTDELRADMEEMISQLSNNDFFFRFSQVEKKNRWVSDKFNYEEIINSNNKDYEELAKEMAAGHKLYTTDVLKKIYSFDAYHSNIFGGVVANSMDKDAQNVFISNSIESFHMLDKYNFSIFVDFIRQVSEEVFETAFGAMSTLERKSVLFACVAARNYNFSDPYPEALYQMVKEQKAEVSEYEHLWRHMPLGKHTEEDILYLFQRIASLPQSFNTLIHMVAMMLLWGGVKDNRKQLRKFIEEEITKRLDDFCKLAKDDDYWHVLRKILEDDANPDFAREIMRSILLLIEQSDDMHYKDYNIEDCMRLLIGKYFNEVWHDLSEALVCEGERYMLYYKLKSILGSMTSYNNELGILFQTDHSNALLAWCAKYPLVAPERLMLMAPLYGENGFSDIVLKLVDLYGEQEGVLTALSCNMGSFSFVGSIVPLYEKQIKCIKGLSNNHSEKVRIWSVKMLTDLKKQIDIEKNRDAEGVLSHR
ncbi:hypothetical protein TFUB4_02169 [Tannerella forsythia]|uniref:hypothetical protein n=1 Tax=Tannerella forsythia TaxID=28112 RepID=UPI00086D6A6F|nr:hypothetical protein [Tannerella forsythia]SCQ22691.1 hypothetical protein TFUB4_02169 [Tannerella forsythia]